MRQSRIAAAIKCLNEVQPIMAALNAMEELFTQGVEVEALVSQRDALQGEIAGLQAELDGLNASLTEMRQTAINRMNEIEEGLQRFRQKHGEEMEQLASAKSVLEGELRQQRIEIEAVQALKRQTEESIRELHQKLTLPEQGGPSS
jgi:SMC interacting uncharacterized protein involved in chromosome segregation